jgi:glycyl-tRNA synthetase beta chain
LPYFKDEGYEHTVITACLPSLEKTPHLKPLEISHKIKALSDLLKTEQGDVLVQGYKRAKNIVTAESQKDKKSSYDLCENFLSLCQEKDLLKALKTVEQKWPEDQNPKVICDLLLTLKQPIDNFFDQVLVNDEDHQKRHNRLALLEKVITFFEKFADFKLV